MSMPAVKRDSASERRITRQPPSDVQRSPIAQALMRENARSGAHSERCRDKRWLHESKMTSE